MKLLTFDEALEDSKDFTRHLLLGNGFSIAYDYGIFNYKSLFNSSKIEENLPQAKQIFDTMGEYDFEKIIRILENTSLVNAIYDTDNQCSITEKVSEDAIALKELLAKTLSDTHPTKSTELTDNKALACLAFLKHFIGDQKPGKIFSLNYDLLLYWTLMRNSSWCDTYKSDPTSQAPLLTSKEYDDGFRTDIEEKTNILHWAAHEIPTNWNIYYLHGAVHLYNDSKKIRKHNWCNTEELLIDQIRRGINAGNYPLLVAEGTSEKKIEKIFANDYLRTSYNDFNKSLASPNNALFIYGHSLAENDSHFIELIGKGKISKLYVSIYGDVTTENNMHIIDTAQSLALKRTGNPLTVEFYDAASVNIWSDSK